MRPSTPSTRITHVSLVTPAKLRNDAVDATAACVIRQTFPSAFSEGRDALAAVDARVQTRSQRPHLQAWLRSGTARARIARTHARCDAGSWAATVQLGGDGDAPPRFISHVAYPGARRGRAILCGRRVDEAVARQLAVRDADRHVCCLVQGRAERSTVQPLRSPR